MSMSRSRAWTAHSLFAISLKPLSLSRLQNRVIDLEVANRTTSPTVDPSVHVFLVGHSMGGIVAAETLQTMLQLAAKQTRRLPQVHDW